MISAQRFGSLCFVGTSAIQLKANSTTTSTTDNPPDINNQTAPTTKIGSHDFCFVATSTSANSTQSKQRVSNNFLDPLKIELNFLVGDQTKPFLLTTTSCVGLKFYVPSFVHTMVKAPHPIRTAQ